MNNNTENKTEFELLKDTFFLCLKNWYVFVATMALCLVLAVVYIKNATPVYNIKSKVVLRRNESIVGTGSIGKSQSLLSALGMSAGKENIEDETKKLSSHGYLRSVIDEMGLNIEYLETSFLGLFAKPLYEKTPIVIDADKSIADTLSAKSILFKLKIKEEKTLVEMICSGDNFGRFEITSFPSTLNTPLGDFTFSKTEHWGEYTKPLSMNINFANLDYMSQNYAKKLDVDFDKKTSDFMTMEFPSDNVPLAKNLLNNLIDNYNREWEIEKKTVNEKTTSFIDERLKLTDESLKLSDLNIKIFKNKYQLTDLEADVKYYYTVIGEMQPTVIEAKSQLGMVEITLDFIKKNKFEPIPLSLSPTSEKIAEVAAKYNELLQKRNDLAQSNDHSDIVKSYDAQINAERAAMIQTLNNTKDGLIVTIAELKKKEDELVKKIGDLPEVERDYLGLRREQEIQQAIYIFLLEMREETSVKGISLVPKLQVIDRPYVLNKKVSPSLLKTLLVVLFFGGFVLPAAIIRSKPSEKKLFSKKTKQ